MHAAAIHLMPVLAAEKSRTAFYICAGVLVLWALFVSVGLGLRRPDFPSGPSGQRIVMAISAVLVVTTAASGVITSGGSETAGASTTTVPAGNTSTEATPTATTSTAPAHPAAAGSTSLELAANPSGQLAYNTKTLAAKAGKVTITMANMSPLPHNVTIAQGGKVIAATPTFQGGSKTLALNLKPGSYTFYCSVPGHRQAGMEGTLKVS